MALLNETSGEFASQFAPNLPGVKSWVAYENAHGGVAGHHINLKVYDNESSPSVAVSNAHLAVEQGAQAFIDTDSLFDSYAPYLEAQGMPVYAFGITPGFYGPNNFFSFSGNVTNGKSDTAYKFADQIHRTKWAVVSDPSPADSIDSKGVSALAKANGIDVVYTNFSLDASNTASLLAVAQAIKSSGANLVSIASTGNSEPQLQVDLSQVGASNVWVLSGSNFALNLPKQFGTALNGYMFESFVAPTTVSASGVQTYLSAMKQYEPSSDPSIFNSEVGWGAASMLGAAIQKIGSGPVTKASIVQASNSLQNFNADGFLAPVSFPAFHTEATQCLSFVQVMNGQWSLISGSQSSPFFCG